MAVYEPLLARPARPARPTRPALPALVASSWFRRVAGAGRDRAIYAV